MNGKALVFVPGIMGSALRRSGTNSVGIKREILVWGENSSAIWKTLAFSPELLGSKDLEPAGVIRAFRLGPMSERQVYGPLIDYCCSLYGLGLQMNSTFRPFAYDWRKDLRESAQKLGDFILQEARPVYVAAHSMGGLVTRLMLNMNHKGAELVEGVFQIASPLEGASSAFVTLRKQPSFGGWLADAMWKIFHGMDLSKQAKLMDAIANMESLYQLLPPEANKFLLNQSGTQLSALDPVGWQERDHSFLTSAREVHKLLSIVPTVPLRCIYSVGHETSWLIAIDDDWNILAHSSIQAKGDGTVTSASATAYSVDKIVISGATCEHTQLCAHKGVHLELQRFLM